MSDLHVGGLHLRNRFRTLSDAVARSRNGDTIFMHKSDVVSNIPLISRLTIDGGGYQLIVNRDDVGFHSDSFVELTLRNLTISISSFANFLLMQGGRLKLDNVKVVYKKGDPRDWYTPFLLTEHVYLEIYQSDLPFIDTYVEGCVVDDSVIGSLFNTRSILSGGNITLSNSLVSNCLLSGSELQLQNVKTYGLIDVACDEADVYSVDFLKLDMTKKQYLKSFMDESLIPEVVYGLAFENGNVVFTRFYEWSETVPYSTVGLVIDGSMLELNGDVSHSRHVAINSTITSDSTHEWDLRDSTLSDPSTTGSGESSAYTKLMSLVGLKSVKSQLETFVSNAKIRMEMQRRGVVENNDFLNHMVFAGPAGTGKTTVAKLLAEALVDEHVLRENKVVVVGSKDLVSKWVGETKSKTHEVIESARGGILFIDEAYSLLPRGENNHNQDAVDQLVEDATKYKDDLIIILAGYDKDMREFIDTANAGLRSRFTYWIDFEPYFFEDLLLIFKHMLDSNGSKMSKEVFRSFAGHFLQLYTENVGPGGVDGNGRFVENVMRDLVSERNKRISKLDMSKLSDEELVTFTLEDVENALGK